MNEQDRTSTVPLRVIPACPATRHGSFPHFLTKNDPWNTTLSSPRPFFLAKWGSSRTAAIGLVGGDARGVLQAVEDWFAKGGPWIQPGIFLRFVFTKILSSKDSERTLAGNIRRGGSPPKEVFSTVQPTPPSKEFANPKKNNEGFINVMFASQDWRLIARPFPSQNCPNWQLKLGAVPDEAGWEVVQAPQGPRRLCFKKKRPSKTHSLSSCLLSPIGFLGTHVATFWGLTHSGEAPNSFKASLTSPGGQSFCEGCSRPGLSPKAFPEVFQMVHTRSYFFVEHQRLQRKRKELELV